MFRIAWSTQMVSALNTFEQTNQLPAEFFLSARGLVTLQFEGNAVIYDPTVPFTDPIPNDDFLRLMEESEVLDFWKTDVDDDYTLDCGEPIQ